MKKNAIVCGILVACGVSFSATAKITPVEHYTWQQKSTTNEWDCTKLGAGYYNAPLSGYTCNSFTTHGRTCYNNCQTECNASGYPYNSVEACENAGGVVSDSCEYNGSHRYKCKCSSDFILCNPPQEGEGASCSIDGETKYKSCSCSKKYIYDESNCSGILGGEECGGKYEECNTNTGGCDDYPYTASNCLSPKVLGGAKCGNTYAECNCPVEYQYDASNCKGVAVTGGTSCGGKWTSCTCPNGYISCPSPQQGEGSVCNIKGVVKYSSCVCPSYYQYDASNCSGTLSGLSCNGKYETCSFSWPNCHAGDVLYRFHEHEDGYSEYDYYWHNGNHGYDNGGFENYFPRYACLSPASAATYGDKTCILNDSTIGVRNNIACNNSYYTHEKTGIMLTDSIAIDTSDMIPVDSNQIGAMPVMPWLVGAYGPELYSHTGITVRYSDDANVAVLGVGQSLSGGFSEFHNALSGSYVMASGMTIDFSDTATVSGNLVGPRVTYNYTFGIPYYNFQGALITSSGLVIADNWAAGYLQAHTSLSGVDDQRFGMILPAWYCMEKNISHADMFTSFPTEKTFAGNTKVYYYLPTAGDWEIFANAVSANTISGLDDVFGNCGGNNETTPCFYNNTSLNGQAKLGAWSSTYSNDTTGANENVWIYSRLQNGMPRCAINGSILSNSSAPANIYNATKTHCANKLGALSANNVPIVTKCFIYVPGWQPTTGNGTCDISKTVSGDNWMVHLSGTSCVQQAQ